MTRTDLDAAEDLHQSTTPGPWQPWKYGIRGRDGYVIDERNPETLTEPDAEFIVQAHRLWTAMCSELRAARKVVDLVRRDDCAGAHLAIITYDQAVSP